MTTLANKALIVNVGILAAEATIRRYLSSMSLNYQSPINKISKVSQDLAPSGSVTFNSVGVGSALTILRCSKPVLVQYNLLPLAGVRVSTVPVTQIVNAFLAVDDLVGSVTVVNSSVVDTSSLIFIQG